MRPNFRFSRTFDKVPLLVTEPTPHTVSTGFGLKK